MMITNSNVNEQLHNSTKCHKIMSEERKRESVNLIRQVQLKTLMTISFGEDREFCIVCMLTQELQITQAKLKCAGTVIDKTKSG